MFRLFIFTALALAIVLPVQAQRRDACTIPEDPMDAIIMVNVQVAISDEVWIDNYFWLEKDQYGFMEELVYQDVVTTDYPPDLPPGEWTALSSPQRPADSIFSWGFTSMYANDLRPELCNLQRMGLIPQGSARTSILGGN